MSDSRRLLAVLVIGSLIAGLTGCNSSSTDSVSVYDYRLVGAYIQVVDNDDTHAVARATRDDEKLTAAAIKFGSVTLAYYSSLYGIDSAYQGTASSAAAQAGDQVDLTLMDGSLFSDAVTVAVVDTFSITEVTDPANHVLQGAGTVSLEWTAAANATAYILAAVKADEAFTGTGFSQMAVSGGTAGTIPPDAFIDPISSEPDTGLYNIYVYAVAGQPDSALAEAHLPTPLPGFDDDNITHNDFTGRIGTITVAGAATIRVALSQ